ncbi:MAG TPA: glutamate--tRNA ligase [Anaerolineae bacterium]|nr:glutamate--tRNA ligase [Anaerolineae bacterium]
MAEKNPSVRVRFAPSPTGYLHVGGARTALFNWLFARNRGGVFILRIEDTDKVRSTEDSIGGILSSLRWLGLDWDEGPGVGGQYEPYFQTQRLPFYHAVVEQLLEKGCAYYCYCTQEELRARRKAALASGKAPGYDRRCRHLSAQERAELEAKGRAPAVRFAMPREGETVVDDLIRGQVRFANEQLDDLVIMKADQTPTYNFAVVVDDMLMKVSHVIRGDEHLANTPRQIRIYEALGYELPRFAHVSMILGEDGTKLSKRHGATALGDFRDSGYLPEAIFNFLALCGWAYDDKTEIMSRADIVERFTLEKVSPSPAVFSREKLEWMNGVYIRDLKQDDVAARLLPFLQAAGLEADEETVRRLVPLIQERIKVLADAIELVDFFFAEEIQYDRQLLVGQKMDALASLKALRRVLETLEGVPSFDEETLEKTLREVTAELGLKAGQLFGMVRVAVTGKQVAPPLFGTLSILGRERVLARLGRAEQALSDLVLAQKM